MTLYPVPNLPSRNRRFQKARSHRPAFSFTEILFAVMILGIGFIMVAAMFPVAIKQTEEAVEDVTAANMAQEAQRIISALSSNGIVYKYLSPVTDSTTYNTTHDVNTINQLFPSAPGSVAGIGAQLMPPTFPPGPTDSSASPTNLIFPVITPAATVVATQNPNAYASFWQFCAGNSISPVDPRFAWIAVYSRAATSPPTPFSQVSIFSVFDRNTSSFSSVNNEQPSLGPSGQNDLWPLNYPDNGLVLDPYVANSYANLQAKYCLAEFWSGGTGYPDFISFIPDDQNPSGNNYPTQHFKYDTSVSAPTANHYFPYTTASPTGRVNTTPAGETSAIVNGIAEGCYIIVADDGALTDAGLPWTAKNGTANQYVSCNGYCYRIGAAVSNGFPVGSNCNLPAAYPWRAFQLMPGGDMKGQRFSPTEPTGTQLIPVRVLVVGLGWDDPKGTNAFPVNTVNPTGNPMDLGVFTTFVGTKN